VILRDFKRTFTLLSEDWSGEVNIVAFVDNEPVELASARIEETPLTCEKAQKLEQMKAERISRQRLIAALELLIEDGLRRKNNNPYSPTYGNLYAFTMCKPKFIVPITGTGPAPNT